MDKCTLNDDYLNLLLETLLIMIDDFNIDQLKFDSSKHINKFINDK